MNRLMLLTALAFSACTAVHSPSDVEQIVLTSAPCAQCPDSPYTADAGGDITYGLGAEGQIRVHDPAAVAQLISTLPPQIPASEHTKWPAPGRTGTISNVFLRFKDGRYENHTVIEPSAGQSGGWDGWSRLAMHVFQQATLGRRFRDVNDALDHHRIASVTLQTLGCYGWCSAYNLTFRSDGRATISDVRASPTCKGRGHGIVPFTRVEDALRLGGAAMLLPMYQARAIDTMGARITIATDRETFVSYGPDETTWSTPFRQTLSRLDQIARDSQWAASAFACAPRAPERRSSRRR